MTVWTVKFERIGRNRNVEPLVIQTPGDDVTKQDERKVTDTIYKFVGQHLVSREYQIAWEVDPDTQEGGGTIDGGRFGLFEIATRKDPTR